MYHTTPPPSPFSPSPPVTPRSGVPLLLQAANRESRSPSRSSTYHYPSSHRVAPPPPVEPMPTLSYHYPSAAAPVRASTAPPASVLYHDGLAFPAPPPPPSPFRHGHGRVDSSVPRYALEDVVVRDTPPTAVVPGYASHYRERSDSSTAYYDSSPTRRGGGRGRGRAASDVTDTGTKLVVVNKEGFLEHDEVAPVRGFWSRWFRGMLILVVFLAIVTGVAIGVSEYYDSKHRGAQDGKGSGSALREGGGGGGGTTTGTSGGTASTGANPMTSDAPTATNTDARDSSATSATARMRTVVRTTSTNPGASPLERSTAATTSHSSLSTTTSSPPTRTTSATHVEATAAASPDDGSDSTDDGDSAGAASSSDPDSHTTDAVDSTEPITTASTGTGRLFGLASATPEA
ncbi:hypothetical protein JCM11491_000272 [Sporobolomyces phaffii]